MKKSLLCAALLTSMLSFGASAELIHSDWKTAGDGLTTIDTSTGLEFLKLTETEGISVNQVKSELDSTYLGWHFATKVEAFQFMESAFPGLNLSGIENTPTNLLTFSGNFQDRIAFYDVNALYEKKSNSYGFIYNGSQAPTITGTDTNVLMNQLRIFSNHSQGYSNDSSGLYYSTWLVKDAGYTFNVSRDVNTPFALSGLALLCFGAIRRKRNH
jgi:hypothetical protein